MPNPNRFIKLLGGLEEAAPHTKEMLKGWAEELKVLQANPAGNADKIQVLSDRIQNTVQANATRQAPMQGPERLRTTNQPQITKSDSGNILIPGEGKSAADLLQESRQVKAGDVLKEGFQDPLQRDLNRLQAYSEMGKAKGIQVNPAKEVNNTESIIKKVAGMGAMPAAGLGLQNPVDMLKEGYGKFEAGREKINEKLLDATSLTRPGTPEREIERANNKNVMNVATDPLTYAGGFGALDAAASLPSALPDGTLDKGVNRFKGLFGK